MMQLKHGSMTTALAAMLWLGLSSMPCAPGIADTAANLTANNGGFITGAVNVLITDGVAVADLAAIEAFTTGTVTASGITDTADNLAPAGVANSAVGSGTNVTVTDAATIAQLTALDAANGEKVEDPVPHGCAEGDDIEQRVAIHP